MRVYCRFIWNYENYHLSLYRVFHGIRLLRLRRLVVVRQSIFFGLMFPPFILMVLASLCISLMELLFKQIKVYVGFIRL